MILILLVHQYYLSGLLILFYINQPIWGTSSFCQLCFYLLYADNLLNKVPCYCLLIMAFEPWIPYNISTHIKPLHNDTIYITV